MIWWSLECLVLFINKQYYCHTKYPSWPCRLLKSSSIITARYETLAVEFEAAHFNIYCVAHFIAGVNKLQNKIYKKKCNNMVQGPKLCYFFPLSIKYSTKFTYISISQFQRKGLNLCCRVLDFPMAIFLRFQLPHLLHLNKALLVHLRLYRCRSWQFAPGRIPSLTLYRNTLMMTTLIIPNWISQCLYLEYWCYMYKVRYCIKYCMFIFVLIDISTIALAATEWYCIDWIITKCIGDHQ